MLLIVRGRLGSAYVGLDAWILLPAQYTVKTLSPKSVTITAWQSPFECQIGSFLYKGAKLQCLLHLYLCPISTLKFNGWFIIVITLIRRSSTPESTFKQMDAFGSDAASHPNKTSLLLNHPLLLQQCYYIFLKSCLFTAYFLVCD